MSKENLSQLKSELSAVKEKLDALTKLAETGYEYLEGLENRCSDGDDLLNELGKLLGKNRVVGFETVTLTIKLGEFEVSHDADLYDRDNYRIMVEFNRGGYWEPILDQCEPDEVDIDD